MRSPVKLPHIPSVFRTHQQSHNHFPKSPIIRPTSDAPRQNPPSGFTIGAPCLGGAIGCHSDKRAVLFSCEYRHSMVVALADADREADAPLISNTTIFSGSDKNVACPIGRGLRSSLARKQVRDAASTLRARSSATARLRNAVPAINNRIFSVFNSRLLLLNGTDQHGPGLGKNVGTARH